MVANNNMRGLLDKIQILSYSIDQQAFHHETLRESLDFNFGLVQRGGGAIFLPIYATYGDDFSIHDRKIIDKIYDIIRPHNAPHSDGGYPKEDFSND